MSNSTTLAKTLFSITAAVTLCAAAFSFATIYTNVEKRGGWPLEIARIQTYISPDDTHVRLTLVRREIEANMSTEALRDVTTFCPITSNQAGCAENLGAVMSLMGESARLNVLISLQTNAETRRALINLQSSKITQAQELLILGLVRSSQRVATTISEPSIPYALLQARLQLASSHGDARYERAFVYIEQALQLDPTNVDTLDLAISVSRQTSNTIRTQEFVAQRALIPLGQ